MGLSQQKLADLLNVKRGKVAGYFYETQAKPNFYQSLKTQFHLDLGKFLSIEMNDENYESFFAVDEQVTTVQDPKGKYSKSEAIDLLLKAKHTENKSERDRLIDEAIVAYGKLINENSQLKDDLMESLKKKS